MQKLKEKFATVVLPGLKKEFGGKNVNALPVIKKVTINARLSTKRDPKFIDVIVDTLTRITGQKPVTTKARKAVAGFKIRQGLTVGAMTTLRGPRMWDFLDKLINISFARIRDFRGIPETAVDAHGNFNYGFREHTAFPEISPDDIEKIHGMQVTITTTAQNREEGLALFRALGFPFKKSDT